MSMSIYPIPLGVDWAYIIRGEGVVMVDGAAPKKAKAFIKGVNKASTQPKDIKLLTMTHGHWDLSAQ